MRFPIRLAAALLAAGPALVTAQPQKKVPPRPRLDAAADTNDPDAYDMYPSWSPDDSAIAFESTRGTPSDYEPPSYDTERRSDMDIWIMNPDGSNAHDVTNDLEHLDSFPDWAPGELIVYDREGTIVLVDPATGARLDVTERTGVHGGFPSWVDRGV